MSSKSTDQHANLQQQFAEMFAHLPEQDIEQFYAHYQLWLLRRRVPIIEHQIELLHENLGENQRLIASLRPSAIALAVLVRLQSSGVSNIEVLDQMLERGEDWLDRMMQRLDYCEQVEDFIQGDYTQWCIRSLEGAYDWIDSVLGLGAPTAASDISYTNAPDVNALEATEELLLQKLSLDDDEGALETTLKQPAMTSEPVSIDERKVGAQSVAAQDETKLTIPAPQPAAYDEIEVGIAEEFLLARENTPKSGSETQASVVESEEPAELADWENLESAEARPEPWYSVNLASDAVSEARPNVMHDWINVLQADAPQAETSAPEVTEISEEALSTPAVDASQAASIEVTPAETSEEEPVTQAPESDLRETPRIEEAQNEPEVSVESEVTPLAAEAQDEPGMSVESEPAALVEEVQSESDGSLVVAEIPDELESTFAPHEEEAEKPEMLRTSDEEDTEQVEQNDAELTEHADALTVGDAEAVAAEQGAELPRDESAAISEEVGPATAPEDAPSLAFTTEDTDVVNSVEVEAPNQSSVEIERLEEADTQNTVEVEATEQPNDIVQPSEQALAEIGPIEESELQADEVASWGYVPVEDTLPGEKSNALPWYEYLAQNGQVAQMPQDWSAVEQPVADETIHDSSPTELAVETPELVEAVSVEQGEVIEEELAEAAVVEQGAAAGEEQSEVAASVEQSEVAERGAEAASDLHDVAFSEQDKMEEAELAESANREQSDAEEIPAASALQAQFEKFERERDKGEGWEMYPEIDATQPMVAFKGNRRMSQAPSPVEPEVPVNAVDDEMPVSLIREEMRSIQDEMKFIHNKMKSIQNEISEIPIAAVQNEVEGAPIPLVQSGSSETPVSPVESAISETPVSPVEIEEPPVKVGFWRRMFGWMSRK